MYSNCLSYKRQRTSLAAYKHPNCPVIMLNIHHLKICTRNRTHETHKDTCDCSWVSRKANWLIHNVYSVDFIPEQNIK